MNSIKSTGGFQRADNSAPCLQDAEDSAEQGRHWLPLVWRHGQAWRLGATGECRSIAGNPHWRGR